MGLILVLSPPHFRPSYTYSTEPKHWYADDYAASVTTASPQLTKLHSSLAQVSAPSLPPMSSKLLLFAFGYSPSAKH